jgi:hypothetical protein
VPENLHKAAHSSPKGNYLPGGGYNKAFNDATNEAGRYKNVFAERFREIANQLMGRYFGP